MNGADALERAFATATCRDRLRYVLQFVDERGQSSSAEVIQAVEDSTCPVEHDLHYAALRPMLETLVDGSLRLSPSGSDWLLDAGRPSPNWRGSVAQGAPELREWQVEALQAWCAHGRHGVVEAVTGTGKSRVGIEATREALAEDYSVIIMVPTVELVGQWVRALKRNSVPSVGALGDGKRASFATHHVIVGTVQSLYLDPPIRPDGKVLLVADECHRYGAGQWSRALHSSYRRRLGLTATFERNDDGINQLLSYFGGGPVYRIGFQRAIADGVVAHYDVRLLSVPLNPAERRAYDEADRVVRDTRLQLLAAHFPAEPFGAFLHEVQKAAEDDPDPTISDIARRYLKAFSERIDVMTSAQGKLDAARLLAPEINRSRGSILFTRRVEMSEEIAETLVANGVKAAAVHSETGRAMRQDLLTHLKIGRLKALVAPTILDEGLDVPDVDLGVVMGGSRSRRQMIQRMGRVLRLKTDGRKATFIVVYAADTAEDITRTDGAEGCLDLIVESADTVTHLVESGGRLQPATAEITTRPSPPAARTVEPSTRLHSQSEAGRSADQGPETVVREIVATSLPMTSRILDDYQAAHGVDENEAIRDLRQILTDFKHRAKATWWTHTAGAVAMRHQGFELVVTADRFVRYASHRSDALTWPDLRGDSSDGQRTVSAAPRPPAMSAPGPPPAAPTHFAAQRNPAASSAASLVLAPTATSKAPESLVGVDPTTVMIDSRVVRDARQVLGMQAPRHAQAEDRLREMLAADLVANPTMRPSGRLVEIEGVTATWTVRGDGRVVHRVRLTSPPATDNRVRGAVQNASASSTSTPPDVALLERQPELLFDVLEPGGAVIELASMSKAATGLGLVDVEGEEALTAVRQLLAEDLQDRPDITSALGRFTVHGRRATWTLRARDLSVITIDPTARQRAAGSHALSTLRQAKPDLRPVDDEPVNEAPAAVVEDVRTEEAGPAAEQVQTPSEPGARSAPPTFTPTPTVGSVNPAVDLVSQIERLAALKERGFLSDDEFAAAKAKLLS